MAEKDSPHYINFPFTKEIIEAIIDKSLLSYEEIPIGWNNKAIILQTITNEKYLFRITKPTFPKEKILNELYAFQFIKQYLPTIPIPTIIQYGFDEDQPIIFPFHWILMEFIDGRNLQLEWENLSKKNKENLLQQITKFYQQFQTINFQQIGGWGQRKSNDHSSVMAAMDEVEIVPYFVGNGLYCNEKEYILGKYSKALEELNEKNFYFKEKETNEEVDSSLKLFENFKSQLDKILDQMTKVQIVVFHGDFAFRNILVAPTIQNEESEAKEKQENEEWKVVGVIDWEWSGTRPIYEEYQWDLLEDGSAEEQQWIKEQLKWYGIDPSNQIPYYSERKLFFTLFDEMEIWRWEDNPSQAVLKCQQIISQFLSLFQS